MEISNTPIIFLDIDGVLNSSISHHHAPDDEKIFFGSDWVSNPSQGFQDFIRPSPIMIVGYPHGSLSGMRWRTFTL